MSEHLSNRLAALAADIRSAHATQLADVKTIGERAISIGNMLLEAKESVKHGEWLPWLEQTGLGERTAQRYMRLAKHGVKSDMVSDLGINRVLANLTAGPLNFDLAPAGEVLWLGAKGMISYIWEAREHPGFYLVICHWYPESHRDPYLDPKAGHYTCTRRPMAAACIPVLLRMENFPIDEAEVLMVDRTGDTAFYEDMLASAVS